VALQSRGLPIAPPDDPRLEPFRQRGRQWFEKRIGQLNFSCAQCHADNAGQRLGGSVIPAGASRPATDLPARVAGHGLAAAAAARLHERRARRAVSLGSIEMTELELYLARAPPACASRRRRYGPESAARRA
jgi:sulfur-oxidizing protein SoxA